MFCSQRLILSSLSRDTEVVVHKQVKKDVCLKLSEVDEGSTSGMSAMTVNRHTTLRVFVFLEEPWAHFVLLYTTLQTLALHKRYFSPRNTILKESVCPQLIGSSDGWQCDATRESSLAS